MPHADSLKNVSVYRKELVCIYVLKDDWVYEALLMRIREMMEDFQTDFQNTKCSVVSPNVLCGSQVKCYS